MRVGSTKKGSSLSKRPKAFGKKANIQGALKGMEYCGLDGPSVGEKFPQWCEYQASSRALCGRIPFLK